jgi:hypothetical protein
LISGLCSRNEAIFRAWKAKRRNPAATLVRIVQALKPGWHVLLTMKQGEGTSMAKDGRVFVLWRDQDLRWVFGDLGFEVVDAFTNTSVLGSGEP